MKKLKLLILATIFSITAYSQFAPALHSGGVNIGDRNDTITGISIINDTTIQFIINDSTFNIGTGATGSAASTFLDLSDSPSSYAGEGLKLIRVAVGETTIEFVTAATIIASKLDIADTSAMLVPYINRADTAAMLITYIDRSDTSAMLSPYLLSGDITGKLDIADTASMLVPYINRSDTAAMLTPYLLSADIAGKLNVSDTASMLTPYINRSDTAAMLLTYIDRSDTASMLSPYAIESAIDHNAIINTHNLTTDIDHDALTNFAENEHRIWEITGAEDIHADRISETSVTQHEAAIDHDALTNFVADEHVPWGLDGVENIYDTRITSSSVTQHEANIDHDALTNTHNLGSDIDHNATTNYLVAEHTNHSNVTIQGTKSLTGGDNIYTTTTKTITLELDNDETSPGNSEYYGTDATGTKGYSDLELWLETLIPGITDIDSLREIGGEILRIYYPSRYYDVYAPVSGDTTNWYFSQIGGDDSNDGHTIETPKQTFPHLLTLDLEAGDSVFFNKGDTWRLTADGDMSWIGASGNHITFTSYGSGDKPRILGSDTTTAWSDEGSDVWSSNSTFTGVFDPSGSDHRIWFLNTDGTIAWGVWESGGTGSLNVEYEFYYNAGTDIVYVYSTSDPSSAFTSVEVPIINFTIELQCNSDSAEYYTFDDLEIAYTAWGMGIRTDYPGGISGKTRSINGIEVRNCLIHHGGSKNGNGYGIHLIAGDVIIENNEIHNWGRRGVSINADGSVNSITIANILIQDNYFHDSWHTTGPDISNQDNTLVMDSITIRRNIIEDDTSSELGGVYASNGIFLQNTSTGYVRNIWIYNNLFKNSPGRSIARESVDSVYIYHNTFYGSHPDHWTSGLHLYLTGTSDFTSITNNIIYSDADGTSEWMIFATGAGMAHTILDYNLYYTEYPTSYNSFASVNSVDYRQSDWAAYKSATGWDANSPTPANPIFKNTPDSLRVYSTSDAVGAGVDIAGYTTDYEGVTVSSPPNIGAYENTEPSLTTYYVSTTGDDNDPGTFSQPFATWDKLDDVLIAGDIAYIRGGTYTVTGTGNKCYWNNLNGTVDDTIKIYNYPGEVPIMTAPTTGAATWRGVKMENSEYVHIKGLKIYEVNQDVSGNLVIGFVMYDNNSNCVIENCVVDSLDGIGYAVQNSTDMLFLNCDASHLKDPYSGSPYGGADGFAIWGDVGNTRTTYKGCRAWFCSDDGFDRFIDTTYTIYDSCWAFFNGYTHDYAYSGDGNGFKLGPATHNRADTNDVYVINCIAASNKLSGFNENSGSNQSSHYLFNNFAYATHTGRGFHYGYGSNLTYDTARNNVSYVEGLTTLFNGTNQVDDYNSWNGGVTVTNADFISLDTMLLDDARQADGSLPNIDFGKLVSGSDLIDAGIAITYPNVLPYNGSAPDMGWYESDYTPTGYDPTNRYIDATGGSDANSGTHPDTAWQTISKVNSYVWSAGDTCYFKFGEIFRGQINNPEDGSSGNHLVFTTKSGFGTGAKPIITTAENESSIGDWADQGGNIWWNSDGAFTVNVGNLIFQDGTIGKKESSVGNVNAQGDFFYDYGNNRVVMYSVGNPATFYTDIECAINTPIVDGGGSDYITYNNLSFKWGGRHGISYNGNTNDITITECDFIMIGGCENYEGFGDLLGNGIEFYTADYTNIIIERNYFEDIFDAAITPQYATTAVDLNNWYINGNVFVNVRYALELAWGPIGEIHTFHFNNNTCYRDDTYAWVPSMRWSAGQMGFVTFYEVQNASNTDVDIYNNIFYYENISGIESAGIRYNFYPLPAHIDIDYNLYYSPDAFTGVHCLGSASGVEKYTLATWQAASGTPDLNGYNIDPDFKNPITNFRVGSGSTAVDNGIAFGEYTTDYENVAVGTPPNIGAIETTED